MRSQSHARLYFWPGAFLLLALALIGCGGGNVPLVEVKGKVYYGKDPLRSTGLDQATVQFYKMDDGEAKSYQGKFDEEGNYALKAPAGKYKALVIAAKIPKSKEGKPENIYAAPESVIPKIYGDPTKTKHVVEVTADAAPGAYDIKLDKLGS